VGRRNDGYHLLESLFWPVDFGDVLFIQPSDGPLKVQAEWGASALRTTERLPQNTDNLVHLAARKLGVSSGLTIEIKKSIPLGAGLGGGSSNAAAFIRYFAEKQHQPASDFGSTALELGADVPFFLQGQPAWVHGVGEFCDPVPIASTLREEIAFVLIVPPFSCPTPKIFATLRQSNQPFFPSCPPNWRTPVQWGELKAFLETTGNDLERAAMQECPGIGDILSALRATGPLYSALSGSGSTCFGVYPNRADAEKSAQDLKAFCRTRECSVVTARTYSP
jgi:4-diphosphocytidyl-2-C-methyl-D-erythritol kinase